MQTQVCLILSPQVHSYFTAECVHQSKVLNWGPRIEFGGRDVGWRGVMALKKNDIFIFSYF